MEALGIVSALLMLAGFFGGLSVGYPFTGLATGLSAVAAVIIFLGDDE